MDFAPLCFGLNGSDFALSEWNDILLLNKLFKAPAREFARDTVLSSENHKTSTFRQNNN